MWDSVENSVVIFQTTAQIIRITILIIKYFIVNKKWNSIKIFYITIANSMLTAYKRRNMKHNDWNLWKKTPQNFSTISIVIFNKISFLNHNTAWKCKKMSGSKITDCKHTYSYCKLIYSLVIFSYFSNVICYSNFNFF